MRHKLPRVSSLKNFPEMNQKGFSFIQLLITAGIGVIVALGSATTMVNLNSGVNGVKFRSDADTFNEEIRALLSSRIACTNSFAGRVVGPAANLNFNSLFDDTPSPGAVKYTTGSTYGDNTLILASLTLSNYLPTGTPNTSQMTLTSVFNTAKEALGAQSILRTINLIVEFNPVDQKITSCFAVGKQSDGIWQRSAVDPNKIYYSGALSSPAGGNVGIGTTNPQYGLHLVQGDVMFENDSTQAPWTNRGFAIRNVGSAPAGPSMRLQSARGSLTAMAPLFDLDSLGAISFDGHNGTQMLPGANISSHADGVPGILAVPGALVLWTSDNVVGPRQRMTIRSSGRIGIGTPDPIALLQVGTNGDGSVAIANAWNTFSDRRLKNISGRISNSPEILNKINGYYFTWKTGSDRSRQIGVIAQEIEAVLPELVSTGSDGIKTVDYPKLTAVLIEANKELQTEVSEIRAYLCAKDPKAPICKKTQLKVGASLVGKDE